mmetsp:Transcript_49439/g.137433  ORF Transcript_49439/g.137433 Transcript_49439/m.137433 type:complete len:271 (+) Transcript_49439:345-1157(+)
MTLTCFSGLGRPSPWAERQDDGVTAVTGDGPCGGLPWGSAKLTVTGTAWGCRRSPPPMCHPRCRARRLTVSLGSCLRASSSLTRSASASSTRRANASASAASSWLLSPPRCRSSSRVAGRLRAWSTAVRPRMSVRLRSACLARRVSTASSRPWNAAAMSGVTPPQATALMSACAMRQCCTAAASPTAAACTSFSALGALNSGLIARCEGAMGVRGVTKGRLAGVAVWYSEPEVRGEPIGVASGLGMRKPLTWDVSPMYSCIPCSSRAMLV